jgi:hypothetical protein
MILQKQPFLQRQKVDVEKITFFAISVKEII